MTHYKGLITDLATGGIAIVICTLDESDDRFMDEELGVLTYYGSPLRNGIIWHPSCLAYGSYRCNYAGENCNISKYVKEVDGKVLRFNLKDFLLFADNFKDNTFDF